MAKTDNGKVSIANILALIGLAGIGVISFFGMLLHSSDGTPGGAIIGAIALVAALAFFLFISIKAKSAKDNPDKWRYVEWASVIIYILIAYFCSSPFLRMHYVYSESDNLKKEAQKEIDAINKMRSDYDFQQKKYIDNAVEQIKNYNDSKQISSTYNATLTEYVQGVGSNVDGWAAKASIVVKLQKDEELEELESELADWNVLTLSSFASRLEAKDKEAWTSVEKKIRLYGENNKLIPVISGGGTQSYFLEGMAKFDLGTPPEPQFANSLRNANGSTILGWIVYSLLHALVLLNYVVTVRTNIVGPRRGKSTGGVDL